MSDTPLLLSSEPERHLRRLLGTSRGFLPAWTPASGEAGYAVAKAFSRFMGALAGPVNEAPDKNKLAFYDLLGMSLLPASAARAPVAFEPVPNAGDASVPAGTRVGATGEDGSSIVFESEDALAVAGAPLAEVRSVWPGRDAVADHSEAALRGQAFTWFEDLEDVDHHLYLGHADILALSGPSRVLVTLDVARPASEPLELVWEYWDGDLWRRFKDPVSAAMALDDDSVDGTQGLTRSGVVRLVSECATAETCRVHTTTSYWVRCRVDGKLPSSAVARPPEVERVVLQSVLDRSLPALGCAFLGESQGLLPESAYADDSKLDLTKSVEPLGTRPALGTAFYLASDEVFGRPGAEVELCFTKLVTPEEEADEAAAQFEADASNVEARLIQSAEEAADAVLNLFDAPDEVGIHLHWSLGGLYNDVKAKKADLATDGLRAVGPLHEAVDSLLDQNISIGWISSIVDAVMTLASSGMNWLLSVLAPGVFTSGWMPISMWVTNHRSELGDAIGKLEDVARNAESILDMLAFDDPTIYQPALGAGAEPPEMTDPTLTWEYWDGRRWKSLSVSGSAEALRLRGDGPVTFTVPDDLCATEHGGTEAFWIRARLTAGGYGVVRLMSWKDENSGKTNFFPLIEYRAPVLDRVRLGYTWASDQAAPEACLTFNDSLFADRTGIAAVPGSVFTPFEPIEDPTPAMYFGFDGTLPAGDIGLFLDLEEVIGDPEGPALVWEGWDGAAWTPLDVEDDTSGMALPGMVRVTWPGGPDIPEAMVLDTSGDEITLVRQEDRLLFATGDLIYVLKDDEGELATVSSVSGLTVTLDAELDGAYGGGTVAVATLPRFGIPRAWIRARLTEDVTPRETRVLGVHPNTVWTTQLQSFTDEKLGSGTGEEEQVFFLRHTPVVDEVRIELRELEGPRAQVERSLLMDEVAAEGLTEDDVREVTDPVTGDVKEIWVRWKERPSTHFVSPEGREFVLEHSRGRIVFPAKAPPPGKDNVLARSYHTAGGSQGNVAEGAVTRLLSGVVVKSVTNVAPAEGASDGEEAADVLDRGPTLIRNRRQAVTRGDYEELAREASPAVAVARALPATHSSGRHAPGWVTLQIVPRSEDSHPVATFGLRESVRAFVEARAPAALAGRVGVIPANYHDVGAQVVVRPTREVAAADLVADVEDALAEFFHPLTGGPEGTGWRFGRDVHASDVATRVGGVDGVDLIESLTLTVGGALVGAHATVPGDRLVAAGMIKVALAGEGE